MANCHEIFKEFNAAIRLSKAKKDSLRKSRNKLREKIEADFEADGTDYFPRFKGHGSFTLDTIVNPIDAGKYDLDDGVYFDVEEKPSETPTTFHKWIYDVVDEHTDQDSIDKNPCVRVIFADGHHIDLTIYYKIGDNHPYLAHKAKGWWECDPKEFIDWFNGKLDKEKQLRRIVRYLKAWADYKAGSMPAGLVLTILAAENYVNDERDDVALTKTCKAIHDKLKYFFQCYRPTTPTYENLLSDVSKTDKEYFLNALEKLVSAGEKAIAEPNQKDACLKWEKQFGDRFPTHLAEDKLDEATKYASPAIINTDGQSA